MLSKGGWADQSPRTGVMVTARRSQSFLSLPAGHDSPLGRGRDGSSGPPGRHRRRRCSRRKSAWSEVAAAPCIGDAGCRSHRAAGTLSANGPVTQWTPRQVVQAGDAMKEKLRRGAPGRLRFESVTQGDGTAKSSRQLPSPEWAKSAHEPRPALAVAIRCECGLIRIAGSVIPDRGSSPG